MQQGDILSTSNLLVDRDMEEEQFDEEELEEVPGSLLKKVARSKRKMREFFVEVCKCYIPPSRDLTAKFCQ